MKTRSRHYRELKACLQKHHAVKHISIEQQVVSQLLQPGTEYENGKAKGSVLLHLLAHGMCMHMYIHVHVLGPDLNRYCVRLL